MHWSFLVLSTSLAALLSTEQPDRLLALTDALTTETAPSLTDALASLDTLASIALSLLALLMIQL